MADKPILFSAPMVRALLAGTKTQTRRLIKPQPIYIESSGRWRFPIPTSKQHGCEAVVSASREWHEYLLPHQRPWFSSGDRLWVKETWAPISALTHNDPGASALAEGGFFRADASTSEGEIDRWRPSIFMPRNRSRITLLVDEVRVDRLQSINNEDAEAEGVECDIDGWRDYQMPCTQCCATARESYRTLWDHINGEGAWASNPWVVAYTFRVVIENIDYIGRAAA